MCSCQPKSVLTNRSDVAIFRHMFPNRSVCSIFAHFIFSRIILPVYIQWTLEQRCPRCTQSKKKRCNHFIFIQKLYTRIISALGIITFNNVCEEKKRTNNPFLTRAHSLFHFSPFTCAVEYSNYLHASLQINQSCSFTLERFCLAAMVYNGIKRISFSRSFAKLFPLAWQSFLLHVLACNVYSN